MQAQLYVFPDTNLFVQCRALHELDWKALFGVDSVTLVITAPVMAEIDRQKGGQGRLAKRARTASGLLRKLLDNDSVVIENCKNGTQLTIVERLALKAVPDLQEQLDYSTADGSLVGIVAEFTKENPGHKVRFLSHDTGPLLNAKRVGVAYERVPDEWLLPPETDEEQKRIAKLEADLERYRKSEPECTITAGEGATKFKVKRYRALSDEQVQSLISDLRARYPMDTGSATIPAELIQSGFGSIYQSAKEKDLTHYRNELYPAWLAKCEKTFRLLHNVLDLQEAWPVITFRLCNSGARPADNVLVQFEVMGKLGGIFEPNEDAEAIKPLRLPSPPEAPAGKLVVDFIAQGLGLGGKFSPSVVPSMAESLARVSVPERRDPNSFYWKTTKRSTPHHVVELTCEQWRHQDKDEDFVFHMLPPKDAGVYNGAVVATSIRQT